MIAVPIAQFEKAIDKNKKLLDTFLRRVKSDLNSFRLTVPTGPERAYLDSFSKDIRKIFYGKPDTLGTYSRSIGLIAPALKKSPKKGIPAFSKRLIDSMGYDRLRKKVLPVLFHDLGIKTCVYCNAMLTISSKKGSVLSGRFQADHYMPKADYPCFSISLYNLYPVCGPCNNAKGKQNVQFSLYSQSSVDSINSDFDFLLDSNSMANYLLKSDIKKLVAYFLEPVAPKGYKNFDEVFGITGIYETQKDIIAELIQKAKIYKPVYLDFLSKEFPELMGNTELRDRFLIGNYTKPADMHKRPLAKFTMDIARDLGILV